MVSLERENIVVFYNVNASKIQSDKRDSLWWEGPCKKGSLWWERPCKKGRGYCIMLKLLLETFLYTTVREQFTPLINLFMFD
jgi:hypothetical protein